MNDGQQLRIERLSLRVQGVDPLDARALAQAVADGLAGGLRLGPGETSLSRLSVRVQTRQGEPAEQLAARTADQVTALVNRVSATEAGR